MRVLVTGGAGFIGSAVVRRLLADGHEVCVVDKFTYAANPISIRELEPNKRLQVHSLDICEYAQLQALIFKFEPNGIMHLAAETHVDRSIDQAAPFIQTNIVGTHSILEATLNYWRVAPESVRNTFRYLQISTDEVFGSLGEQGLFNEQSPYDPSSPYSASKAAADHLARAWFKTFDLPVLITNCSNNYGPRQHPEKLIPLTILNAFEGLPIPVYGDGQNVRDWLFVEDHADALCRVLEKGRPGETYNVGGDSERRNIEVVRGICALLDLATPGSAPHGDLIRFVPDRLGHDRRYAIDFTKVHTELDWSPVSTFEQGLAATVEWYLAHREWWSVVRAPKVTGL